MSIETIARLKQWLADDANFFYGDPRIYPRDLGNNELGYTGVRRPFVTRNGYSVSIQQSATHYCRHDGQAELWNCPPSPLLASYGGGSDPYAYVPLEVVAGYIDSLESLPPKDQP